MQKWEYMVFETDSKASSTWLDGLGKMGWELIAIREIEYFFKRKKTNDDQESSYTYETVEDGYVIYDHLGKKIEPYQLVKILNNAMVLSGTL